MHKTKSFILLSGRVDNTRWEIRVKIVKSGKFEERGCLSFKEYESTIGKRQYETSRKRRGFGMCLFCGDIDWRYLEEHHPDKEKLPDFKVTLCANCHRALHWDNGSFAITGGKKVKW